MLESSNSEPDISPQATAAAPSVLKAVRDSLLPGSSRPTFRRLCGPCVTKIINQIRRISEVISSCDWTWSQADELELGNLLKQLPCGFILSMWHSNEFRKNTFLEQNWNESRFHFLMRGHFYHVGSPGIGSGGLLREARQER